jgi:hypothetical protein
VSGQPSNEISLAPVALSIRWLLDAVNSLGTSA